MKPSKPLFLIPLLSYLCLAFPRTPSPRDLSPSFQVYTKSLTAPYTYSNYSLIVFYADGGLFSALLAILQPPPPNFANASTLQLNGTAANFQNRQTTLIWNNADSMQILPDRGEARFVSANATKGIYFDENGNLQLQDPKGGSWYGCYESLFCASFQGYAVRLFWLEKNQTIAEPCQQVVLQPKYV